MKTNTSIHKLQTDVNQILKTQRVLALRAAATERMFQKGGVRALWLLASGRLQTSIYKEELAIVKEGQKADKMEVKK